MGSPFAIPTWQLVPWQGFSVPQRVISQCFLGPSFSSVPGSCLELQFHSAVSKFCKCLFLFFQFGSTSVWELRTASCLLLTLIMLLGLNPKPIFRLGFAILLFICKECAQRPLFPTPTATRRKQAALLLSLCSFCLCVGCVQVTGQGHERGPFLDTQQLYPSHKTLVCKWLEAGRVPGKVPHLLALLLCSSIGLSTC